MAEAMGNAGTIGVGDAFALLNPITMRLLMFVLFSWFVWIGGFRKSNF